MSSGEEDNSANKKRKLVRACDLCRGKKLKCDGLEQQNGCCTRCVTRGLACTYHDAMQKATYPRSYVENLEQRLERLEQLLSGRASPPGTSGSSPESQRTEDVTSPESSTRREIVDAVNPSSAPLRGPFVADDSAQKSETHLDGQDASEAGLLASLARLSVDRPSYRYHGNSSALVYIRAVMFLKATPAALSEAREKQARIRSRYAQRPWLRRTKFDKMPVFTQFPPDDLMYDLIDLYFREWNDLNPILHEPTFRKSFDAGVHYHDGGFGATVLLVCANGAHFSNDPRTFLKDHPEPESAGWQWYGMVEEARKIALAPAQLYDLQIYALMASFLLGTECPQASWTLLSMGIRAAIEVGAHRKTMYSSKLTVEEELWRRAFWWLVATEWQSSYGLGRPPCVHDEDIDAHLPTECDDEYWLNAEGEAVFQQPPDKPSRITGFNLSIRLAQIVAFASRTLYALNSPQSSTGEERRSRIVTELDSALNNWVDSLPPHLRWDPERTNMFFLKQSTYLYAYYYNVQIAVHRQYMMARTNPSSSFPSLIICANAARSCVHVVHVLYKLTGDPYHRNMNWLFWAGLTIGMNSLGEQRFGRPISGVSRDITLLEKCVEMLLAMRRSVHVTGHVSDMIGNLVAAIHPEQTLRNLPVHAHHEFPATPSTDASSMTPSSVPSDRVLPPADPTDAAYFHNSTHLSAQPSASRRLNRESGSFELGFSTQDLSRVQVPTSCPPRGPPVDPLLQPGPLFGDTSDGATHTLRYNVGLAQLPAVAGPGGDLDAEMARMARAHQQQQAYFLGATSGPANMQPMHDEVPDLAFVDDMLAQWNNAAQSFVGWDEWANFIPPSNGPGSSGA
ncbi:fungal-specific transcription factor domain-containing protein [Epithele typhae]|uniref:fungal-specific transcription factor domain-containing protein n=1 Tax=Epithele typhae TaxID=378194 RepID=UPI002007683C|nr:fungal-specific transcription factor domain-containing protein [Epithele typhae]KAH9926301.1 fungal-specific transcription factor domain-containing protein [Epithele typhae]